MIVQLFKSNFIVLGTATFLIAILLAHIVATQNYDWTKNTISDLGAQLYERKIIMQFGFVSFGTILSVGIILNGFSLKTLPILLYALSVGLTGFFCTKPFFQEFGYSVSEDNLHSFFAQVAGIAFTVGILVQLFFATSNQDKIIHTIFILLVLGMSISFGLSKNYPGIFQRLLYLVSFVWLIFVFKID